MGATEAVVVREAEREWEGWTAEERLERGEATWKTLISSDRTATHSLTLGIARLRPGERLREHRHPQAEVYVVLSGELALTVGDELLLLEEGASAWVPGGALHSCANRGVSETRFAYAFAVDSAAEIAYDFPAG
jgi:mannose-6-phosphate isomerase-like protein (cupin superfamily)